MPQENPALKDKFARHLNIEVVLVKEDYAKVKLAVQAHFINGAGFVQGGVIFTLADFAFGLAANSQKDSGLAVNVSVNFIKAALPTDCLFAEAKLVSRTRKLGTYQAEVTNQDGAIIARCQTLAYFK